MQAGKGLQIGEWHRKGKRLFAVSSSGRAKHHEMVQVRGESSL